MKSIKKTKVILGIFLLVFVLALGGFFLFRGEKTEEEVLPTPAPRVFVETTLAERPFVSLTPSSDGHWLTIEVSRIQDAEELEYELTYETSEGLTQGAVGGPFSLEGKETYEKKILLGTESRGHYRYHEGVDRGSLMIRLDGGKGPRKFTSDFILQEGGDELVSADDQFRLSADLERDQFYLVMMTMGLPAEVDGEVLVGPYGIFTSGRASLVEGKVEISNTNRVLYWNTTDWQEAEAGAIDYLGVFVSE